MNFDCLRQSFWWIEFGIKALKTQPKGRIDLKGLEGLDGVQTNEMNKSDGKLHESFARFGSIIITKHLLVRPSHSH